MSEEADNIAPLKHEGRMVCDCCYVPIDDPHADWCAYYAAEVREEA